MPFNESSKALSSTMPRTVKQKEQNLYNLEILNDLNKNKKARATNSETLKTDQNIMALFIGGVNRY